MRLLSTRARRSEGALEVEGEVLAGTAAAAVPAESVPRETRSLRVWRGVDGQLRARHPGFSRGEARPVRVCRLFPWSRPAEYVSLRDEDEEEVSLVRRAADLDSDSRAALEEALAEAGFVFEITAIRSIEEEIEIRTFEVETQQGPRTFQTERDEWPRELRSGGVLLRDVAGDLYVVWEPEKMDATSRRLLWVFLD